MIPKDRIFPFIFGMILLGGIIFYVDYEVRCHVKQSDGALSASPSASRTRATGAVDKRTEVLPASSKSDGSSIRNHAADAVSTKDSSHSLNVPSGLSADKSNANADLTVKHASSFAANQSKNADSSVNTTISSTRILANNEIYSPAQSVATVPVSRNQLAVPSIIPNAPSTADPSFVVGRSPNVAAAHPLSVASAARAPSAVACTTSSGLIDPFFDTASGTIWDANTTADWGTVTGGPYTQTWTAAGGGSGALANFEGTAGTVIVNGAVSVGAITFSTDGYTLAGTGSITFGNSVITVGGSATISTALAGAGNFTKTGAGTLILSGANNTYTGGTIVNTGTLQAGAVNTFGSGLLRINGGAMVDLKGYNATQTLLQGVGELTDSGAACTLKITGQPGNTCSNVFSGAGLSLYFSVFNTTYTLTANSTYGGGTTLDARQGWLKLGVDNALPIGGNVTLYANQDFVILDLNGHNQTIGSLTLNYNNFYGTTYVTNTTGSSTLTITNGITAINVAASARGIYCTTLDLNGANQTINIGGNTVPITSVIQNGGIGKAGAGTLTLSGNNTYAGGTTLGAGIVNVGTSTALGTGTITFSGGSLQAGANNLTLGNSTIVINSGQNAIVDTQANTFTLTGVISGSGSLTKAGTGALTLSGNNSYIGATTVNGGTLLINGNNTGTGAFTVNSTATLSGNGTIAAAVTLNSGAMSPGVNGVGALTVGSLTLGNNSTLNFTFSSGTTVSSVIVSTGTLTLNNTNRVNLTYSSGTVTVGTYNLIQDSSLSGTGTLSLNNINGLAASLSYTYTFQQVGGWEQLVISMGNGSFTWNGGGSSSNWSDSGNWGGTAPSAGSMLVFGASSPGTITANNDFSAAGSSTFWGITFQNDSYTLTGNAVTITGHVFNNTGTLQTISLAGLVLGSGNHNFNTGTGAITVSSPISGVDATGALVVYGSGTLMLTGSNSYSGGTTLLGGILNVGTSTALGTGTITFSGGSLQAGANNLTLGNSSIVLSSGIGAVVDTQANTFTLTGVMSGSGSLTKVGAGTLTLRGANTFTGGTTLTGGILNVGTTTALGAAASTITFNGGTLQAGANNLTLGNSTIVLSSGGGVVDTQANTFTLTSVISGSGSLTKVGAGTLTLNNGKSAYTGNTFINNGVFTVNQGTNFASANMTVASGAVLNFNTSGAGTISSIPGATNTIAYGRSMAVAGAGVVQITGSGYIVAGGGGTVTFNMGSGSFFDVQSSDIQFGWAHAAFASNLSGLNVASGAGYHNSDTAFQFDALTGAGTVGNSYNSGSVTLTLGVNNTQNNATYGVVGNTATFSGSIKDHEAYNGVTTGNLNLIKTGTGTQILSGNNTYQGTTTVNGGTLLINGNNTGTGAFTVNSTATLSGNGTIAAAVTLNGGALTPGVNGVGTLTVGSLTLGNNSTLNFTFSDGTTVSSFISTGALTLNGTTYVNLTYSSGTVTAGTYNLIKDSSLNGSGILSLNNINGTPASDSFTYAFQQNGGWEQLVIGGGFTWNGSGGSNWSNGGNWVGGAAPSPGGLTVLMFGAPSPVNTTANNDFSSGSSTFYGFTFQNNSYTLTGNAATITGVINNNAGVLETISLTGLVLGSGNHNFNTGTGAITVNSPISDVDGTGALTVLGSGTLTLNGDNSYSGGTALTGGILDVGTSTALGTGTITFNGGSLQAGANNLTLGNSTIVLSSGIGAVVDTQANTFTLTGVISGSGSLTKIGTGGVLVLAGANTYNGGTTINAGTITLGSSTGLGDAGGTLTFGGSTAALNMMGNNATVGALVSTANGYGVISAGTSSSTLTVNQTANTTYSGTIQNGGGTLSLVKSGAGTLILAGNNTYTGLTTVNAGRLTVNNSLNGGLTVNAGTVTVNNGINGAVTLNTGVLTVNNGVTGAATVNSGGVFNATGSISGLLTLNSGGIINPVNGVGTLTVGSLTLGAGSILNFEFGAGNDLINVLNSGGLTLNGGGFNLYQAGGTTAFSYAGTYNLIRYNGALNGNTGSLSVLNPNSLWVYTFGVSGGYVTLNMAFAFYGNEWVSAGLDNNWTTGANWGGGSQPGTNGSVNFGGAGVTGSVNLNGATPTLSAINFRPATPTTISGTGSITMANGGATANIAVAGQDAITSPMVLNDNVDITVISGGALTLSGTISGSKGLTKDGVGVLTLSHANSFSGGVTLNAGQLNINTDSALGTSSSVLTINGGMIDSISSFVVTNNTANAIHLNADFTFIGSTNLFLGTGVVTMNGSHTVTVNANTLMLSGTITDGGGAFSLTKAGSGTLSLAGTSSFSGGVILNAGQLNINNAKALGTGLFTINGGTIGNSSGASTNFAVTVSTANAMNWNADFAFNGTANLNLGSGTATMNSNRTVTVNANTLTIGGTITDGGGGFSLTKAGSGTLTFTRANSYTGGTAVNGGMLTLDFSAASAPTDNIIVSGSTLSFAGFGGGTLNLVGKAATANSQTFTNTFVMAGADTITVANGAGGTITLNLGTITRSIGSGLNFTSGSGAGTNITTASVNTNSILGTWATVGVGTGTTYATVSGGTITAYAYTADTSVTYPNQMTNTTGTANYNISIASGLAYYGTSVNTIRCTDPNSDQTFPYFTITVNGLMIVSGSTWTISDITSGWTNPGTVTIGADKELVVNTVAGNITIASYIIDNPDGASSLTKLGSGILTLASTNTFTGSINLTAGVLNLYGPNSASSVNLNNGTLYFTNNAALGTGTLTINGGTLQSNGRTISNVQKWNGDFVYDGVNGGLTSTGTITLGGNRTVTVTSNILTLSGLITDNGNGYGLTKVGAGTLVLSHASYGGVTTLNNGALTLTGVNNFSGGVTMNYGWLNFNSPTSLNGVLTINGGTINNSSGSAMTVTGITSQNWNNSFYSWVSSALNLGTGTVTLGANVALTVAGNTLTVGGVITDNGAGYGLTKLGNSWLVLTGSNTYTGPTTISAGTLRADDGVGLSPNSLLTINGGILETSASLLRNVGGSVGYLQITGGASGFSTYNSPVVVALGGTLSPTAITWGSASFNPTNFILNASTATAALNFMNPIALNGADIVSVNSASAPATMSGTLSGTGSLVKLGVGTLILTGSNTYTGGTTINSGTLSVSTIGDAGAASGIGYGTSTTGTLTLNGCVLQFTGVSGATVRPVVLNSTDIIDTGTGTVALNGTISGGGGLTKVGLGTLTLGGVNTYSGDTLMTAGVLQLQNATPLPNSMLNMQGGVVNFGTPTTVALGGLKGGGTISLVNSSSQGVALTVGSNNQSTYFGGSLIGSGSIIKTGTGAWILTGANSYTGGTTVNAGILQFKNAASLPGYDTGTIAVNGTSILAVNAGMTPEVEWSSIEISNLLANANLTFAAGGGFGINTSGGNFTYSNAINTAAQFMKLGNNTLTLTAQSSFSNGLTVNGGTLTLDFGSYTNNLVQSQPLTLGGGILNIKGNAGSNTTQSFGSITVGSGAGQILVNPNGSSNTATLTLGVITANTSGGSLLLGKGAGASGTPVITTTGTVDATGIYGSRVVYTPDGGTTVDWASTTGGSGTYTVSGYTAYDTTPGHWNVGGAGMPTSNVSVTNAMSGITSITINSLKLGGTGAYQFTLNSFTLATIKSGGLLITGSAAPTIAGSTLTTGSSQDLIVQQYSSNAATISSIIAGSGALVKTGPGTLYLTAGNMYTGGTYINQGNLNITGDSQLGAASGNITFNGGMLVGNAPAGGITMSRNITLGANGGTIQAYGSSYSGVNIGGVISGSGNLYLRNAGGLNAVSLLNANTFTGNTVLMGNCWIAMANALALQYSTLDLSQFTGGAYNNYTIDAHSLSSSIVLGGLQGNGPLNIGTLNNPPVEIGNNNLSTTYGGVISGVWSVQKIGSGTLTLSGVSTYGGPTYVSLGTLNLANQNAIQNSQVIMSGGTLMFDSSVAGKAFNIAGLIAAYSGPGYDVALQNNAGAGIGLTLGSDNSADTYAASLTGSGSITKVGTGTWTLSGTNSYTGSTTISAGMVQFTKEVSLYNNVSASWTPANVTVNNGASIAFNVGGAGEFTTGDITTLMGNLTTGINNNGLKAGSIVAFDTSNASSGATITANIGNSTGTGAGAIGLAKLGTGTLYLTGSSTYTGPTTINTGTLSLGTVGSIGNSQTITVKSGAVFDVSGITGYTLNSGQLLRGAGTIQGNAILSGSVSGNGPGILTFANNATLTAGGTYVWGLNSVNNGGTIQTGAGVNFDQLAFGGALTLNNTGSYTITLAGVNGAGKVANWNPFSNYQWTIANAGTIVPGGGTFGINSTSFASYNAIGSGSFTITTSGSSLLLSFNGMSGAQNVYWSVSGSGIWDTGTTSSWTYDASGTGVLATWNGFGIPTFAASNVGNGSYTVSVSGTVVAPALEFGSGSANITGGTIVLSGGTITVTAPATGTISSTIADGSTFTTGLIMNGTGKLTLSGANTFTGGVIIQSGTLAAGGSLAFGGNTVILGDSSGSANAALSGGFAGTISNPIVVASGNTGVSTITDTAASIFSGLITLNNNLTVGGNAGNALTLSGGLVGAGTLTLNATGAGTITLSSSGLGVNNAGMIINSGAGSGTVTISASIGANVTGLIQNSGGVLVLNNSGNGGGQGIVNQFTGLTQILQGTIKLNDYAAPYFWKTAVGLQKSPYDTTYSNGSSIGLDITGVNGGSGTCTVWLGGLAATNNLASAIIGYNTLGSLVLNPQTGTSVTYGGVIADGAAGMTLTKNGPGSQTLTNANNYTGATLINAGTLALGGSLGSILNSTITVKGGVLSLDNSGGTWANRVSDSAALSLGSLNLISFNGAGNQTETVGATTFATSGKVTITNGTGGSDQTTLALGAVTRSTGAAIDFAGTGTGTFGGGQNVTSASWPALVNGILPWATVNGTSWATTNASGSIVAYSGTFADPTSAASAGTLNAQLTGSASLASNKSFNSLNLITSAPGQSFTLNNGLTLTSGAILKSGTDAYTIGGSGSITAGSELIAHVDGGALTISAPLNTSIVNIAKGGTGSLILSGTRAASFNNISIAGNLEFQGNSATLTGAISGPGGLTCNLNNGQVLWLTSGGNTYTGTTLILGGVLNSSPGTAYDSIPGYGVTSGGGVSYGGLSNITLNGTNSNNAAILGVALYFGRYLGAGPDQIQITGGVSGFSAAYPPGCFFMLNGNTDSTVVWGSTYFQPTVLVLNDAVSAVAFTFANRLDLNGATRTIAANNGTWAGIMSNVISDSVGGAGLTKIGVGELRLTAANTYAGVTTVSNGMLTVSVLNAGGSPSGIGESSNDPSNLVLGDGTTLKYIGNGTGADTASTDRNFTINGASATLDASGSVAMNWYNSSSPSYGTLNQAFTLTLTGTNTAQNTLGANIADNGTASVSLSKTGTGMWVLTGLSAYTGTTTFSAGVLSISGFGNLGSGGTLVFNGGTLQITGTTIQSFEAMGNPVVFNSGATVGLDINDPGNTFTMDQVLNQGAGGLIKAGSGTLTLIAANSYTGPTTINNGILELGNNGTIGSLSPSSAIINNSTLIFNRADTITQGTGFGTISGTGQVIQNGGGTVILNSANSYTGGTTLNAGIVQVQTSNNALGYGTVTFNGGILQAGGNVRVENIAVIANGNAIINTLAGNTLTMTGGIGGSGSVGLTKNGLGTLVLTGNASTYDGATVINGGTLKLVASVSQPVSVSLNNPSFETDPGVVNGYTPSYTTPTGWTSSPVACGIEQGTSHTWAPVSGVTGLPNYNASTNYKWAFFQRAQTLSQTITVTTNGTYTVGFAAAGRSGGNGPLDLQVLIDGITEYATFTPSTNAWNTYTGTPLYLTAGTHTLSFNFINNLGGDKSDVLDAVTINGISNGSGSNILPITTALQIANGATLDLNGCSQTIVSLSDITPGSSGAIINSSSTTPAILTVDNGGSTFTDTFSGTISDSGTVGMLTLVKTGVGSLTLAGANSYSGGTTINGGTLMLGSSTALGAATGTLTMGGGVLDMSGYSATVGALTGSSGTITGGSGTPVLTVNQSSTTSYSGVIQNGGGTLSFVFSGGGTLALNGHNTYSGATTINIGSTLFINGVTMASAITVNNGGALGGHGSVGNVTVASGGMINVGTSTFTVTNLVLGAAPVMQFSLAGDGSTASGQIIVSNQLNVSNMSTNWFILSSAGGAWQTANTNFTLIHSSVGLTGQGSLGVTNFDNLFGFAGWEGYLFTQGNDVMLQVVPEPEAYMLVCAGMLGLLALRRFRKK